MRSAIMALLLLAGASPAMSQASGKVTCHVGGGYLVVERERVDDVGSEFLARSGTAAPSSCTYRAEAGDYRIGGANQPLHFTALVGDYLVLESSTGPAADLVVHDLKARKRVLSQRLTESNETKVEGDLVRFTMRVGTGRPQSCKDWARFKKDGGSGEIGAPATFDLRTGRMERGAGTVCTYAQ